MLYNIATEDLFFSVSEVLCNSCSAVYEKGPARPTGGCAAVAMLIGDSAGGGSGGGDGGVGYNQKLHVSAFTRISRS
jgi:hypothetical protein